MTFESVLDFFRCQLHTHGICEESTEIDTESHSEASTQSLGFLGSNEKFSAYFRLWLAYLIFEATENLSLTPQYKDTNARKLQRSLV